MVAKTSIAVVLTMLALQSSAAVGGESVLYRFSGGTDGATPMASMIADQSGNLFGTTNQGGGGANCSSGCGTVFELSPPARRGGTWKETVVHSFQGGSDGASPQAPIIFDVAGNLYGATSQGGSGNCDNVGLGGCGTIFELSPPKTDGGAWTETVLYGFQGVPSGKGNGDAAWPNGLVFDRKGSLYGLAYEGGHCTTDETGTYCNGAAFRLKKSSGGWSEKVIYRFRDPAGSPAGPVLDSSGDIYGTGPGGAFGCGAVFELQPPTGGRSAWSETSLYDFRCGNDGAFPLPGLTFDQSGNLYSTSVGTASGYGSVFELSPNNDGSWSQSVLYNFKNTAKGYVPTVGPILGADGRLYGTTEEGGRSERGVVFELSPPQSPGKWTETMLFTFGELAGGIAPYGGLNFGRDGALYGTTVAGGNTSCNNGVGCGVIFRISR